MKITNSFTATAFFEKPVHTFTVMLMSTLLAAVSLTSQAQEKTISLSTTITGNQEQPKILYIVPWQPASSDAKLSLSIDSQLGSVFDHLERSELQRQMHLLLESKLLEESLKTETQ